jgi:hypothetical protein
VTLSPASRSRTASARPIWDVGVLMTRDMDHLPVANPQRAECFSSAKEGIATSTIDVSKTMRSCSSKAGAAPRCFEP